MVDESNNTPFYVLKRKDSGKEKIVKINSLSDEWSPRRDKEGKFKYFLDQPSYVNGVLFYDGWYQLPFWALTIVDKKGNEIQATEPHGITEMDFVIGDDLTAEDMDKEDELPPLDDIELDTDDDDDVVDASDRADQQVTVPDPITASIPVHADTPAYSVDTTSSGGSDGGGSGGGE